MQLNWVERGLRTRSCSAHPRKRFRRPRPPTHLNRCALAKSIQKISYESHKRHEIQRRKGITTFGKDYHCRANKSVV